jgi:putative endonuclease
MAFVYILKCAGGAYYTGSAKDLLKRIAQHKSGKGAKYTRAHLPVKLVYSEEYLLFGEALKREIQIKKLSHDRKKALIKGKIEIKNDSLKCINKRFY